MSESPVPVEPSVVPDAAVPTAGPEPEAPAAPCAAQPATADPSTPPADASASQLVKVEPVPAPDPEVIDPILASLDERERLVIQCLGGGMNMADAAKGVGVDPRTIYRWIKNKPAFAAAFNAWKQETYEIVRARALTMGERAMGVIDAAIDKGNLSASLQVARGLGMLTPPPRGDTEPSRVFRERNIVERLKEKRLHELETQSYACATDWTKSVEGWDNLLRQELHQRDGLVWEAEMAWREYEKTLHLTPEECQRLRLMRPKAPPAKPRPSRFDALASFERMCQRMAVEYDVDPTPRFNKFVEDGRIASEAAKGREQALSALGLEPILAQPSADSPTSA